MTETVSIVPFTSRTVARLNARSLRAPALSALSFDKLTDHLRRMAVLDVDREQLALLTTQEMSIASSHAAVYTLLTGALRSVASAREAELERRLLEMQREVAELRLAMPAPRRTLARERLSAIADEISRLVATHEAVRRTWAVLEDLPADAPEGPALIRLRFEPGPDATVDTVVDVIRAAHRAFARTVRPDERECVELDADSSDVPA